MSYFPIYIFKKFLNGKINLVVIVNLERLCFLREDNDLKQIDIANLLNIKQVNISNWERTKEIIPLNKLNIYMPKFDSFKIMNVCKPLKNGYFFVKFYIFVLHTFAYV